MRILEAFNSKKSGVLKVGLSDHERRGRGEQEIRFDAWWGFSHRCVMGATPELQVPTLGKYLLTVYRIHAHDYHRNRADLIQLHK